MKKLLTKRNILIAFIAFLVIGQFFPIDKTNPPLTPEKDFITATNPPAKLASFIKNACYDCHSHEATYPWYTSVFPVSRWIGGHIKNGRKKLNFSTWEDYDKNKKIQKLEASVEAIETNWMPMKTYVFMHPEAKMTDNEKLELATWFKELGQKL